MKIVVAIIGLSLFPLSAFAENAAPSRFDAITQAAKDYVPTMPSVSLPSMPDFSLPDFSKMGDGVMTEFMSFTQQIGDTIPVLQEMGYEVSTFRVQWGLPPKAKLRLRSKGAVVDLDKIAAIAGKATGGVVMSSLVSTA